MARSLTSRPVLVAGVLITLVLLGGLGAAFARGVGGSPTGESTAAFTVAPDFTLPTFDGGTFTLSEHEGSPVFVVFWASWCVPCQEEAPVIQKLWPEYEARGYTFVGVNIVDTESDARAFIEKYGLTFTNVRDTKGSVYLDWGVEAVAESFFLRSDRTVASRFLGGLKESDLRSRLDALGKQAATARDAR